MGQAKVKQRLTERLLAKHPICCFCGGSTQATSADHVPPRIIFWGKRRPQGLEMPACHACNQGTRKLDQVAGLFARITVVDKSDQDQQEFGEIAKSVSQCFLGWAKELIPSPGQRDEFQEGVWQCHWGCPTRQHRPLGARRDVHDRSQTRLRPALPSYGPDRAPRRPCRNPISDQRRDLPACPPAGTSARPGACRRPCTGGMDFRRTLWISLSVEP